MYTSVATLQIAKDHNLTEYVIFGDSKKFMKKLAEQLYRNNSSKDGKSGESNILPSQNRHVPPPHGDPALTDHYRSSARLPPV
ncbi:hypothetical protein NECAME_00766 [Necator americanus]|uniref:Uncharacterized protein n=1 Tax=Necator americanus TaxID=51031 RepID=W2SVV7_NECAM|nr:hypothetical protein NECAME_00766 [Necator americanus]ETN73678.1 hypothetical protein NECAME_00766 [Necator americanus]